ncbi:MAG: UvrD-helicase domain-containing protein [Candidatus Campbellbacteria bacterium]|nr:UvrD-helicase domain-containing protein [Candidatus Campbellbacteria bacterium]
MPIPKLNKAQKQAVFDNSQSLLILAGAGTGKTRVITSKIINLIESGEDKESIVALTFTNKAAREMLERISKEVGRFNLPWFVGTFHSLGVKLLRTHGEKIGIPKTFSIADKEEGKKYIKKAMKDMGQEHISASLIQNTISLYKRGGETYESWDGASPSGISKESFRNLWGEYESILKKEKSLDFDDLIAKSTKLLETKKDIRKIYTDKLKHILIDEFQDTDALQNNFISLFKGKKTNLYAVGDMDQTIYSWRGSDISFMLNFPEVYSPVKTVSLEENYRSTKCILNAAQAVIKKNKLRKDQTLTTKNKEGEQITITVAENEKKEAEAVAQNILSLINEGTKKSDIAILYRFNFQSRALEEAMIKNKIPYTVLGTKFFDRAEIKDLLAYLRFCFITERNTDLARIINRPKRSLGKQSLKMILDGKIAELPLRKQSAVNKFFEEIKDFRKYGKNHNLSEMLFYMKDRLKFEEYLKNTYIDSAERIQNIGELVSFAEDYKGESAEKKAQMFLENADLGSEQDTLDIKKDKDSVTLMTIHSAKGLEFPVVLVCGLEEGLFPYERGEDSLNEKEEERRLCYVAFTRAKQKLFLSSAINRMLFGKRTISTPSSFLNDIPKNLCKIQEEGGEVIIF